MLEDRAAELESRRRTLARAQRAYQQSPGDCELRRRYKTIQQWMNAVSAAFSGEFPPNEHTGHFIQ